MAGEASDKGSARPKLSLKRKRGDMEMAYKKALPSICAPKLKSEVLSKLKERRNKDGTSGEVVLEGGANLKGEEFPSDGLDTDESSGEMVLKEQDTKEGRAAAGIRPSLDGNSAKVVLEAHQDWKEGGASLKAPLKGMEDSPNCKDLLNIAGTSPDEGLGNLVFCHLCQKDLTNISVARQQQHLNRCCDEAPNGKTKVGAAVDGEGGEFSCVICHKTFSYVQVPTIQYQ